MQELDTRNESQKLYDEQYHKQIYGFPQDERTLENTPTLTKAEFQELAQRNGNTNIDYYNNLFGRTGFSYLHPRTSQRIIPHWKGSKEETRLVKKLQPCVAYKPQTRSIGLKVKLAAWKWFEKTKLHIKHLTGKVTIGSHITTVRQANRSRFRTVWYSKYDRRK